jgi:diguanylate cyclase (GGDEF)-like protein
MRSAVVSTLIAFYSFAIALEFWSGRREPLASRVPLAALCGLNGIVHLFRVAVSWWEPASANAAGADVWFAMLLFQPALIMVAGGIYAIGIGRDRTESELRRTASVDSLTQVLNRGAVLDQAEAILARSRAEGLSLAVLLFDLDRFKDINDTLGHHAGDTVLQHFARVASGCLRGSDIIGRIGGEEFVAILPGVGPASAHAVADRVRREFARERIERGGVIIPATVSVGVVALQGHYVELDELLSLADKALYEAKRAGRDQVRNAWALAS